MALGAQVAELKGVGGGGGGGRGGEKKKRQGHHKLTFQDTPQLLDRQETARAYGNLGKWLHTQTTHPVFLQTSTSGGT